MIDQSKIRKALCTPLLVAAMITLAGCSAKTAYAPQSSEVTQSANGYTSQQIMPDRYLVSFSGNQFTSRERVENYLLYRAAELTQQQGYEKFRMLRENTNRSVDTDIDTIPTAGVTVAYPAFSPYYNFYGPTFGSYLYDPYIGTPFDEERVVAEEIERYDASAIIEMFSGMSAKAGEQTFNASQVMSRIGPVQTPDM
jgi:hypothetical protein